MSKLKVDLGQFPPVWLSKEAKLSLVVESVKEDVYEGCDRVFLAKYWFLDILFGSATYRSRMEFNHSKTVCRYVWAQKSLREHKIDWLCFLKVLQTSFPYSTSNTKPFKYSPSGWKMFTG